MCQCCCPRSCPCFSDRAVIVFIQILRQMIYERPLLALSLCWIEGLIVGGLLTYWLFL